MTQVPAHSSTLRLQAILYILSMFVSTALFLGWTGLNWREFLHSLVTLKRVEIEVGDFTSIGGFNLVVVCHHKTCLNCKVEHHCNVLHWWARRRGC